MTATKNKIASAINVLAEFCGPRDICELTQSELERHSGISQVDIAVLFGGSVVAGADVLASAMKNNLARKYIIVGGAGHTTPAFRSRIAPFLQVEFSAQATEAELFNQYLKEKYNLQADFLECESTNCGNNITLLVSLLQREKIPFDSVLMIHDATMQRRISASWRRYVGEQTLIINFAAYQVKVAVVDDALKIESPPLGMWSLEHYIKLLMGDTFRLQDNAQGYGPRGKNFIAHVDVPDEVLDAFSYLKNYFEVRPADSSNAGTPTIIH